MFTSMICLFLPIFYLQVESLHQKYQIKRNADPQLQTQETVHQTPLTLQIPTFIPQFDPNQSPIFNLASTNSFHSLPLVQPQNFFEYINQKGQNEELQVASTNSPSPEEPTNPQKGTIEPNYGQILDPKFKGIINFPNNQFIPNQFIYEPKPLAANPVPSVIPKGVVHLNPHNGPRYPHYRSGYSQPKTAAQNLYYVNHPVRLPYINYHVLPISGHQRQYAPILYHNHHPPPPPPRFRPHHPHLNPQPLVNSQIRHPITHVQHQQNFNPPRIYGGFQPIPNQQREEPKEEQQENEEVNEEQEQDDEEEEERPKQQEEPRKEYKGYRPDFDIDDFFKNGKYSFPKFGEEEEPAKQKEERGNGSYEVEDHESQEAEAEEDDEESKKTFVITNPYVRHPNKHKIQKFNSSPTIHYGKPKEEFKAFSYSKKINYPRKEIYQGRGSENIPVIHGQKTLHQNWYITKSTL